MRWFEGQVGAAVAETKRIGALFIVYISGGKDAEEKHMSALWDAVDAENDLPWQAVAVKLHEGSPDAKSFAQIYPVPCFPITYFIDGNGKPTNVVLFNKVEAMDADKFREALPKLVFPIAEREASSGLARKDGSVAAVAAPAAAAAAEVPAGQAAAAAPSTSNAAEIAEKIKRAKELLEQKKAAEAEQKRKEDQAKEMQRREDAKEMHRNAEERRNKELLEAAAARRRDKLDTARDRERVKEQIKADKAEREARFRAQQVQQQQQSPEEEQPPRGIAAPQPVVSDRCRIQVRFPDGSTALHDFPAMDALASLRAIVATDARVRGSPFRLAQPAPRRIYAEAEMESTFIDLALTPASTLLVLTDSSASPVTRVAAAASAAVQPAGNPLTTLFGFVTYILWAPIQFMLSLAGMGGAAAPEKKKKDDPVRPSSSSAASQQAAGDTPAAVAAGAAARRRHQAGSSNIHTLSAAADSSAEQSAEDDPEGNWNGNSTQYL